MRTYTVEEALRILYAPDTPDIMTPEDFMKKSDNGRLAVFHCGTWRIYMYNVNTGLIHYKNLER